MKREIAFVLPFVTESLNVRDRKHWSQRSRDKRNMGQEIMAALGGPRHFPIPPWRHVEIIVVRSSAGRLDFDNLCASFKSVGDSLKDLKIIEDDRSDWLSLRMFQESAPPGQGSTSVRIICLDQLP